MVSSEPGAKCSNSKSYICSALKYVCELVLPFVNAVDHQDFTVFNLESPIRLLQWSDIRSDDGRRAKASRRYGAAAQLM